MTEREVPDEPSDHAAVYTETVWIAFLEKTGQIRLMSPAEYQIVSNWRRLYALRHVLEALRNVEGKGKTLGYYDQAVRDEASRAQRALYGR